MARKYGIIDASSLKVAAPRGANFSTGSVHMPRARYSPVMSRSPGLVRPGTGLNLTAVAGALAGAGRAAHQQHQAGVEQDRRNEGAARAMHPAQRSQGAVASQQGGNASGGLPEASQGPSAGDYYKAPTGMGAKVPASRMAKFAQGRGL